MQFWICVIETVTHWNLKLLSKAGRDFPFQKGQKVGEVFDHSEIIQEKTCPKFQASEVICNQSRVWNSLDGQVAIFMVAYRKTRKRPSWTKDLPKPADLVAKKRIPDSFLVITMAFEYVALGILAGLLVCIVVRLYKYLKCFMSSRLITSSRHATRQVGLHIILASWILVSLRLVYHSHLANHYEHASIHAVGERNGLTVATAQNILVCACYEESPFLKS